MRYGQTLGSDFPEHQHRQGEDPRYGAQGRVSPPFQGVFRGSTEAKIFTTLFRSNRGQEHFGFPSQRSTSGLAVFFPDVLDLEMERK
jgi:hypothetical protein